MNDNVVVDANIALKWVLTETDSQYSKSFIGRVEKERDRLYMCRLLLTYEVTNILYREVRAGRITSETAEDGINLIFRVVSPVFSRNSALQSSCNGTGKTIWLICCL